MKRSPIHLYDAHAHLGRESEQEERISRGIISLISAGTPKEAAVLDALITAASPSLPLFPTYGLHPWHTAEYRVAEMEPYFTKCSVIGEIGMDSVWCSVPLPLQEQAFKEQLAIAARLHKPAVLHTKGQEAQIASIIRNFKNTYLIHWYSSPANLEDYLSQDCFFSIGPDLWWNPAVQKTALTVPLDRLLVETDGMGAVSWAQEEGARTGHTSPNPCASFSVENTLNSTINFLAPMRGLPPDELRQILEDNFFRFYGL